MIKKMVYLTEYGKAVVLVGLAIAVLAWVLFFPPDPVQVNSILGVRG